MNLNIFFLILLFCSSGSNTSGACDNDQDKPIIISTNPYFHDSMSICAKKCFGKEDCMYKCFKDDVGLSDGCIGCVLYDLECTIKNCWLTCSVKPESVDCSLCIEKYCSPAYLKCSGVPIPRKPNTTENVI